MIGSTVGQVKSVSMGPLPYFIRYQVSSLVRSDAVWNTMVVKKAISPWIVVLLETLEVRKPNPYLEQMFITLRTKHCLFRDEVVQCN